MSDEIRMGPHANADQGPSESPMSARAWATFVAVAVLWGIPYLLIKIAVGDGVPPAFVAWVRILLGAAILLGLAWRARVLGGLRGRVKWLAAFAVAEIAVPFPLIAAGEQHVTSSLAAILIATAPLFVALLALRFDPSERPSLRQLAGLILGLAGVSGLVGLDIAGRADEFLGAAPVLTAAFCYAVGPMIFKRRLADLDRRASMGASLALAALFLAPAAALHPPTAVPSARAIVALLGLALFCTAAALVLWGALIGQVGAGRALVVTYVNPLVAVALGMAILGERPGVGAIAGLLLILGGSWLSTNGHLPGRLDRLAILASPRSTFKAEQSSGWSRSSRSPTLNPKPGGMTMRFMTTNRANKNSEMDTRQDHMLVAAMDMRKTTMLLWIVQGLLAVLFLFAGGMKLILPLDALTKQMPLPLPGLFLRFIGLAEVLGGIGLILPSLLRIRMVLTPLAACGLVIIMIGAAVYTLAGGGGAAALIPLVVGLLASFVAYGRWRLTPHRGYAHASPLHSAG